MAAQLTYPPVTGIIAIHGIDRLEDVVVLFLIIDHDDITIGDVGTVVASVEPIGGRVHELVASIVGRVVTVSGRAINWVRWRESDVIGLFHFFHRVQNRRK